jgi:hypothetical protein
VILEQPLSRGGVPPHGFREAAAIQVVQECPFQFRPLRRRDELWSLRQRMPLVSQGREALSWIANSAFRIPHSAFRWLPPVSLR